MKTRDRPAAHSETPEQIQAAAEEWFRRQVELLRASYGTSWPEHKAWVISYLRAEVRQRLIARGWRPTR